MHSMTRIVPVSFVTALLVLAAGVLSASAQESRKTSDSTVGKRGNVHFRVPVKAGDSLLQPGMYQVHHALEGTDIVTLDEHVVIFKPVRMPAGYRHSNTLRAGAAAARVKCAVEPADKKFRSTKITLRTNADGETEIADLQIAGEFFKHLF